MGATLRLVLLLIFSLFSLAGQPAEPRRESIVVTGTYEPLSLEEIDRAVNVFPVRKQGLVSNTLADFLRLDPSLDLRQRAPNGLQSDLSIRGATFGQTLVLLNGQRLNDAQSGHHNLDVPVPLESVTRVEVLRGAGSTLYGSDAVGGVVNIITEPPARSEVRLRSAVGNFGVNQQRASLSAVFGKASQQFTFSRDFSSGFRPDRDYRNLSLGSTSHVASPWGLTELVLAYNDRPFGADQFYGNFNSWENTKTWFGSLRQQLGDHTEASFAFRRHSDLFVLYRDRPAVFANHHAVESFQTALRRNTMVSSNVTAHYGVEAHRDSISSNNLGDHARTRGAGYFSLEMRAIRRFSLSLGAREEVYRSFSGQFSPGISAGVWLTPRLKLRAAASRAYRVPTYTDLYYHDPANLGSPDLRPERAWSYEAGLQWNASGRIRSELTVFHRREKDGIDYIRRSSAELWRATNIQNLRFTGLEAALSIVLARSHQLDFRYTGLHGLQDAIPGVISRYAFNYPSHSAIAAWQASLPLGLVARTRFGVLERRGRDRYALWDLYTASSKGRIHPFVQVTNVTGTRYEEILGVVMPGRAVVGGLEIVVK